jgi:acyl-coenzyme A thioesterase PaaI-like protein
MCLKKSERRAELVRYLAENPFATDEQLAELFKVSVATIRLDRAALHIPEARERTRLLAEGKHDAVRSLEQQEVIGDIVDLQLNRYAKSLFHVGPQHVFARNQVVRGHFLFAQVNSLAIALMDVDFAVTAKSEIRFYRLVRLGETLIARADVVAMRGDMAKCKVKTESRGETVLDGFIWVARDPHHLRTMSDEGMTEK